MIKARINKHINDVLCISRILTAKIQCGKNIDYKELMFHAPTVDTDPRGVRSYDCVLVLITES